MLSFAYRYIRECLKCKPLLNYTVKLFSRESHKMNIPRRASDQIPNDRGVETGYTCIPLKVNLRSLERIPTSSAISSNSPLKDSPLNHISEMAASFIC